MSARPFDRVLLGVLAGVAATMAMTATMRRLHTVLPDDERYPLPPREIVDRSVSAIDERQARSKTLLAHFGFGGLTGALFALLPAIRGGGVAYGLGVWALSYLGWIPAARILAPAHRHPLRRNLLMIAAHIVWGLTLSKSLKEMEDAADEAFASSRKRPVGRKEQAEGRLR
ncbi:hypothetical protein SAMN04488498_11576 [Mesorhizobium albiziae]|uniref:DUF1440 domain-containing protein n=1 Tax=Neomesorhizobium albiziae TaxID=335020 RepID=A0A1I4D2S5_9HYPH|nr:hypothetical protein [Mesorhizobium albiziae]GLS28358.1 hypothetical protein GCM10007937_00650 [Mesorhizobium albiziae]SFK87039.1 hypothetical protein SAMN04488498_11576 [Mesorhizobium albiziae]